MSITLERESLASWLSSESAEQQERWLLDLSDEESAALEYDWRFWGRQDQFAPEGEWRVWLVLAGRGWGKTRVGAEWVRESVKDYAYVNLIAPTADDARDIMVEGESGVLAICPPDERPLYVPSKRRLEWPNGARSLIFTADEPERLRGKQHMRVWADELAAWRYPEAWLQMTLGLRLGKDPRAIATTTPKPVKLVRELIAASTTIVTRGSTYDNAENLAPQFLAQIVSRYEGTRIGRQELNAEMLDDIEGALWKRQEIDDLRIREAPEMRRVVVAIDPAVTSGEDSDETGIVVCGVGVDGFGYVLADRTCRLSPDGWARRATAAFDQFSADRIIAEVNNGGDLVAHVIRTVGGVYPYRPVRASRGKVTRAEPIAALYEQGKIKHVGSFPELEDQMCMYTPDGYDGSPDRVDALVWGLSELMLRTRTAEFV
jgi:phage terminase large subunit-like protein